MRDRPWTRASRSEPCPICGRTSYCTRSTDIALCMKVESDRPSKCRLGGWIHRLSDEAPSLPEPPPPAPTPDFTAMAQMLQQQGRSRLDAIAISLSLPRSSLEALGVGAGLDRQWWSAWPERTPSGAICGIKKRFTDGTKFYVKGSSPGLYFPPGEAQPTVFIPEGGTDTAALHAMGFYAIGRPSSLGGQRMLIEKLRALHPKKVIVLGEHDTKPSRRGDPKIPSCPVHCQGCSHCAPGITSALIIARALRPYLHCSIQAALPAAKDVRQWLSQGGKASDFLASLSPLEITKK